MNLIGFFSKVFTSENRYIFVITKNRYYLEFSRQPCENRQIPGKISEF